MMDDELKPLRCPMCGSEQVHDVEMDQDRMGNSIYGTVCFDCEFVLEQQDYAGQCMHHVIERDEIGRNWCMDCGKYLGER